MKLLVRTSRKSMLRPAPALLLARHGGNPQCLEQYLHNGSNPKAQMNHKRTLLTIALVSALLAIAFTGCSTRDIWRVTASPPVSTRVQTGGGDGLKVTVDPFMSKEAFKEETFKDYFGTGKPGPEMLVLHLKAENTSTQAAWILQKENLQLFAGDARRGQMAGPDVSGQVVAGEVLANLGVWWLSLGTVIVANRIATDATVVAHNFMLREWLDTTLYPGQSREAFVYFKLTGNPPDNRYSLSVKTLDAISQQTTTFTVPFTYEKP